MEKQKTPTWQAGINTVAIGLIVAGFVMLQGRDLFGLVLIAAGAGLEWFKYSKRFK